MSQTPADASYRRALFLHTQKTAGSSLLEMGRQFYGKHKVLGYDQYKRLSLEDCASTPFLSGHFGFEYARYFIADRYSFTFLRDPIDRILSFYDHIVSRPDSDYRKVAKQIGLNGVLQDERFRAFILNHQVWQLAYGWAPRLVGSAEKRYEDFTSEALLEMALANLDRFDYVGFSDTINLDAVQIFRDLGWDAPEVPHINASIRNHRADDLSDSDLSLLYEVTELDRRLFESARRTYLQTRQAGAAPL